MVALFTNIYIAAVDPNFTSAFEEKGVLGSWKNNFLFEVVIWDLQSNLKWTKNKIK